jgi:hypothetical protein
MKGMDVATSGTSHMPKLELNDQEAKDLRTALCVRLLGLREELVHTDHREYREGLRVLIERLEAVQQRLEGAMNGGARAA